MKYDDFAAAPRAIHPKGYVYIRLVGHPRASRSGYTREHIAIAEIALGSALPAGAIVHHVDGNKGNNSRTNLVICQDEGYHKFLHRRMRVKAAGGNPNSDWVCSTCQQIKPLAEFHRRGDRPTRECRPCVLARVRAWSKANRAAINARQNERRAASRG